MFRLNFILGSNNLFYFRLFQTHYHILPYPKTKGETLRLSDMGRFESLKVTSSIKKTETISLFNIVSCREKWEDLSVRMAA